MYCVRCGVRLSDSEKVCPLCGTEVFHPRLRQPEAEPPFPAFQGQEFQPNPGGIRLIVTLSMLLAAVLCIVVDVSLHNHVLWAGYAAGAIGLVYVVGVLPGWFRKPNPVVFVPLGFLALGCYLLYIDLATGGRWFLSFAFPLVGIVGLLTEAVVTLCYYLRRGRLYVFGGAFLLLGGFMMLFELFAVITFGGKMFRWSLYPTGVFSAIGVFLLLVATIRPLRRVMHRLFFV